MKKIYLLSLAAILSVAVVLVSCHKEDETKPEPEPNKEEPNKEEPKIVYDSSGVDMLLSRSTFTFFNKDNHNPLSDATDCNCFSIPINIAASYKLYDPFEIKVLDTLSYTYRYQVASFSVTDASGENLAADCSVPETADFMAHLTHKELKPNTEYTASVTITLAQLVNGEWKQVTRWGNTYDYSCSVKFTTGELPGNKIDSKFISYQYPIDRQLYYLPEEYKQGYIMLGYSYNNIFSGVSDQDMKLVITSISDENQPKQTTSFTYKECNDVPNEAAEINYSLDNITFNPQTIYRFDFLCGEDTIYYMHFATSKYPDLKSKILANYEAFNGSIGLYMDYEKGGERLVYRNTPFDDELFDQFEFEIDSYKVYHLKTNNMIHLEMDLESCEWYNNSIYKVIYDNYTSDRMSTATYRSEVSYPPFDAIHKTYPYYDYLCLDDNEIEQKALSDHKGDKAGGGLVFWFLRIMYEDYLPIRQSLNNKQDLNEIEQKIINTNENDLWLTKGDYPYYLSYHLPGKNIVTFKEKFVLTKSSAK